MAKKSKKRVEIKEEAKAVASLVVLETKDAAEKLEASVQDKMERSAAEAKDVKEEAKAVADLVALEAKDAAEKVEDAVEAKVEEVKQAVDAPTAKNSRAEKAVKAEAEKVKADVKAAKSKVKATRAKAKEKVKSDADKAKVTVEEAVDTARTAHIARVEKDIQYKSFVQFAGDEVMTDELFDKAIASFKSEHKRTAIEKINLYIKPEDRAAYYVINDKFAGRVDF